MKRLLFASLAVVSVCAFGSLARAGTEYVGDQRPAAAPEAPRTYIPLLPPLPFLPVPTLVIGGHGPAPAVVPIGGPAVGVGVGPGPGFVYGRPYPRRRWRRYPYGPYPYGPGPYGYYGGPRY
jgi:hypothetical protein